MTSIRGIVFDKDGTLFDFRASWGSWSATLVRKLSGDNAVQADLLASAIGFDLTGMQFAPHSPVVAGTPTEIAQAILPHLPGISNDVLVAQMNLLAAQAIMVETIPLSAFLDGLRARGLRLGLATNDAKAPARAHLAASGIASHFDFVAGFDSGHGAKPMPGMLLAFAKSLDLDPADVVMVGDSQHDLIAGRAAGMVTVAVLTGIAERGDLTPYADAVLPDVGHLSAWLDERNSANRVGHRVHP